MEKYVIFVLCVLSSTVALPPKVYRKDYEYNKETDAFYKLHIEKVRYWQISSLCEVEGAQLMIPDSDHDIIQLYSMFKKYPDLGDYVWVGNDAKRHESAEEQPIINLGEELWVGAGSGEKKNIDQQCDVATRNGDIETAVCYRELPFICKVAAKDAPYDQHCRVYGKDYRYYSSVGSCYKIPRKPFTWSQAFSECQAENAHLLVLNSEAEHAAIVNLTNTEEKVSGAKTTYFFFAGFRADKPTGNATLVFRTIFNQTLEEAGYSVWSENEPNNALGREFCGSIFKTDGKLNDVDCTHNYGFICEKEVPSSL